MKGGDLVNSASYFVENYFVNNYYFVVAVDIQVGELKLLQLVETGVVVDIVVDSLLYYKNEFS